MSSIKDDRPHRWIRPLMFILFVGSAAQGYPLDGYPHTGIARLKAFQLILGGKLRGHLKLLPGALLTSSEIQLHLKGVNDGFDITAQTKPDPYYQAGLTRIFGGRDPSYSIALLDMTNPRKPLYAALRPDRLLLPGSVGKALVMSGLFQVLARTFPTIAEREHVLEKTVITADRFILTDSHRVPIYDGEAGRLVRRPLRIGDRFSLWEWIDHMVSPSSNAGASTVWKTAMLLARFGKNFPPSTEEEQTFFKTTPKRELAELGLAITDDSVRSAGLNVDELRQGTFFTATGAHIVPGTGSYASPRELLRWLIRLEQGKLVDGWSSLEMKKLLYLTRPRYRYAAAPELAGAAVYFKSGSKYKCKAEAGFKCSPYHGNVENVMNSMAIVESPARGKHRRIYMVTMMSNVLRVNSAAEHAQIAGLIERLVRERPRK